MRLRDGKSTTLIAVMNTKNRLDTLNAKDTLPNTNSSQCHWIIILAPPTINIADQLASMSSMPDDIFSFSSLKASFGLRDLPKYSPLLNTKPIAIPTQSPTKSAMQYQ